MKWRKWLVMAVVTILVVPPIVFAGWAWLTLSYSYSQGERTGYLQKMSRKGWLCKTWEGELAMVNLPGAMPEIFHFSVRNDAVVKDLSANLGQRVTLSYDEHRFVPTRCFGETSYFASGVHPIADASIPK